jgi:hypothetical protein
VLVRGQVVEADSTAGVADAIVTLAGPALSQTTLPANGVLTPGATVFSDGTPTGPRRVATDAQGRFLFRNVPAGTFTVTVTASGYMNGEFGETRPIQIRSALELVRALDVRDGERPPPVTIRLWKLGGISGVVLDEANEPVVAVPVAVLSRVTDWGGPVMQSQMTATTDDRGSYHADVPPGDYLVAILASTSTVPATAVDGFLQAMAEGGAAQQAYLNGVAASGGLLPRGAGVRTGDWLVNQLALGNRPTLPPIVTREGGLTFYPTTYHPSSTMATSATVITLRSGEEKSGIDIHLRPVPVRRVSGLVTGPNGPVPHLALRLIAQDPAVRRTSPATVIDPSRALTDHNGAFTFLAVAPGAYTLAAFRAATVNAGALWALHDVSLGETDIDDLQIVLRTGALISGHLVFEGSQAPPPTVLRTIGIALRPIPGSTPSFQQSIGVARIDTATLQFATAPIVPGLYTIAVSGVPSGWILKSVTANGANLADQAFELPASGVSAVAVTLSNRISMLSGIARDAESRPMPSATIAVFPADKALWLPPGVASRRVQTTAPMRDGRYTIRGLPAGEYFVVAADWPAADFTDGNVLTKLIPSASRVTIDEGTSRTQDLRVVGMR